MKIREIISKEDLPFGRLRMEANKILTELFRKKKKDLAEMLEETAEVRSPIIKATQDDGITTTYYFSTQWGTVIATLADSEEDSTVKFVKKKLELIKIKK